ncbi:MAG: hypothetical protein M1608_18340 [Candidatus Omnitrophica bacterium]|nr:hypothetical protein [Candidatus Omnitrophota bacterium]
MHFGKYLWWAVTAALFWSAGPSRAERIVSALDGEWDFQLDPGDVGKKEGWFGASCQFTNTIQVPGAWQAQGYGVESDKLRHHFEGKAWYKRQFLLPASAAGRRIFLCVGGVHRSAEVWVNNHYLGGHIGYLSPFEFELTPYVSVEKPATIALCVDCKQQWEKDCLTGCFDIIDAMFTPWGGIWGHVKIEARPDAWLENVFVQPRISPAGCRVTARIAGARNQADTVRLEVRSEEGRLVAAVKHALPDSTGSELEIETELPEARLWSPDSPYLYSARLALLKGGTLIDQSEVNFGLREIQTRGCDFFLNGKKLYLRGYGDDGVYPRTMAAPSDKAFYRKRLETIRKYGFNFVRHHSHILPPEYYEAADEIGMFVSAEFPIAYDEYYRRAQGPALDLYRHEWAAAILRLRNHPSIFDWCMSNEMWDSFALAPEMYRMAKALDPARLVIDSDGLWPAGFVDGTKDRATLDFYSILFDEWSLPLDKPAKYRFDGQPKKPVLSHETGNYTTLPRLSLINEFKDNFKPFWLTPFRDKLLKMGLIGEADQWSLNSERLYYLSHKLNVEAMRKNPRISGYMWWLFQDYWTGANGLVDAYFRSKSITPDMVRQFNDAVVLLEDGLPQVCAGRQNLKVKLLVSNYSTETIRNGLLQWRIRLGPRTLDSNQRRIDAEQGELAEAGILSLDLPESTQPERVLLTTELEAGGEHRRNEWSSWEFPAQIERPRLERPVYASLDLAGRLASLGAQPLPLQATLPDRAVYVVRQPTMKLVAAAEAGACLVCLAPQDIFSEVPNRFKPAWWLGSQDDCNAGTVVYDNPVTRSFAPEGWCDAGWYRLLEGARAYVLDELPLQPEVLVRALDVHSFCRNKALLFQARIGKGALIVCGLRLGLNATEAAPEQRWLLTRLLEYASTLPQPKAALPVDFLRKQIAEVPFPEATTLPGYAHLISDQAEHSPYASYREAEAPIYLCRQTEIGRVIEWETAVVPANWPETNVTFVFAGGLGWHSQPRTDGFALLLDGRELVRFDVAHKSNSWSGTDGTAKLCFIARKLLPEDALGQFYLTVPSARLKPGKPCRLAVRSLGQSSRRWFGLNLYVY